MKTDFSISQIHELTPPQILDIINSYKSTIDDQHNKREALKSSIRARDDIIDRLRGEVLLLEEKLHQEQRADLFLSYSEVDPPAKASQLVEANDLKEKLAAAEKKNEALKRSICERDGMINTYRTRMSELDEQLYKVGEQLAASEKTREKLKVSVCERDGMINTFRTRMSELDGQIYALEERVSAAEKAEESLKTGICERDVLINTYRTDISELDTKVFTVEDQLKTSEKVQESLKTSICERDVLINTYRTSISELDEKVFAIEEKISAAEKHEEQLKRMIRGRDGLIKEFQERIKDQDGQVTLMERIQEKFSKLKIENIDMRSQIDLSGRELEALKRSIRSRDSLINNFKARNVDLEGQLMQVKNVKTEGVVESPHRGRVYKEFGKEKVNIE